MIGQQYQGRADELNDLTHMLAQFDCPIWVIQPVELHAMLQEHARRLMAHVTHQI